MTRKATTSLVAMILFASLNVTYTWSQTRTSSGQSVEQKSCLSPAPAIEPGNPNTSDTSRAEHLLTNLLARTDPAGRKGLSLMTDSRAAGEKTSFSIAPFGAGPSLPVTGSGTLGRLTKWAGFTSSNSVIGDTTIFEDKSGNVGVGTDSPTSRLSVAGIIQSLGGGIKFPDGSVQTSSAAGALFSVVHDATLEGAGTALSPLQVASPLEVRDRDNPAQQPFQAKVRCSTTLAGCGESVATPTGQRVVVEFVTIGAFMPVGEVAQCGVSTTAGGRFVFHDLPLSPPAVTIGNSGGFTSFAQGVRIYADPGSGVSFSCVRSGFGGGSVTFLFSISGYLVDLP